MGYLLQMVARLDGSIRDLDRAIRLASRAVIGARTSATKFVQAGDGADNPAPAKASTAANQAADEMEAMISAWIEARDTLITYTCGICSSYRPPTNLATSTARPAPDAAPGEHKGLLEARFRPGVHDPENLFEPKETAIADRLAREGYAVHPRHRDATVPYKKNPDAMVRSGPDDPGTITEFKTPRSQESATVKSRILDAGKQLSSYGGGDAVIDGRPSGLTEENARRAYARAVGQARVSGQYMPARVHFILADDAIITLPES